MNADPRGAPPRNSSGPILPKRLAHALSLLAQTLPNPWDESTDYFTPFSAELADDQALTPETLRHPLAIGPQFSVDLADVDLAATGDDYGDEEAAKGFRLLDVVMRATLTDIRRISARAPGVVRVRTWVVGRFKGGWLVGLRTESTET
jgi:hypothetical protein